MRCRVEFLQSFTFVIKHTSGKSNKVVDALSRVNLILQEFKVNTLGFDELIAMYKEDADFQDIYAACENPVSNNRSQWLDYIYKKVCCSKTINCAFPSVQRGKI